MIIRYYKAFCGTLVDILDKTPDCRGIFHHKSTKRVWKLNNGKKADNNHREKYNTSK